MIKLVSLLVLICYVSAADYSEKLQRFFKTFKTNTFNNSTSQNAGALAVITDFTNVPYYFQGGKSKTLMQDNEMFSQKYENISFLTTGVMNCKIHSKNEVPFIATVTYF